MSTFFWRPLAAGLALMALALPAAALELKGRWVQGGMLVGRADPGTAVVFQGRAPCGVRPMGSS